MGKKNKTDPLSLDYKDELRNLDLGDSEEEILSSLNKAKSIESLRINRGILPELLDKAVDYRLWNLVKNLCLLEKKNRVQEPNYIHLNVEAPFARACLEAVREEEWDVVETVTQPAEMSNSNMNSPASLDPNPNDINSMLVNSDILNQIIDLVADAGKWNIVKNILKLESSKYKPNPFALNETLKSALEENEWKMVKMILNNPEYIPDFSILEELVAVAVENQKWDVVQKGLKKPGYKPSSYLLDQVITFVAEDQQWDLFKYILKIPGYKPELGPLLKDTINAHEWDLAKEILKTSVCVPDKTSLNQILNMLVTEKQWDLLYSLLNLSLDPQQVEIRTLNKLMHISLINQKWDLVHYIALNFAREHKLYTLSEEELALYKTNIVILEKTFEAVSFECDPSLDPFRAWQAKETLEKLLQWGKFFKPELVGSVGKRLIQYGYQKESEENKMLWKLIDKYSAPRQFQTYDYSDSDPDLDESDSDISEYVESESDEQLNSNNVSSESKNKDSFGAKNLNGVGFFMANHSDDNDNMPSNPIQHVMKN